MGKAKGRRRGNNSNNICVDNQSSRSNGRIDLDVTACLKRAFDLKEEGNRRFQSKDYARAIENYDNSLKLVPDGHPDSAVVHSNKAACLMQMHPVDYDAVISECSMAIQVNPQFTRAILRRVKAFEAVGDQEKAMHDVKSLLTVDPTHSEALAISRRLQALLCSRKVTQRDSQSIPSSTTVLGASTVRATPVVGLGLELPTKITPNSKVKPEKRKSNLISENKYEKLGFVSDPDLGKTKSTMDTVAKLECQESNILSQSEPLAASDTRKSYLVSPSPSQNQRSKVRIRWRPLKLVYGHDIRLAKMPASCSLLTLREIIRRHFPASKSVLIKFKDSDDDLVTLTSTDELKLAELHVDSLLSKEDREDDTKSVAMLRLHVVDVFPEQEPSLLEYKDDKLGENESLNTSSVPISGNTTTVEEGIEVVEGPTKKSSASQIFPDQKPEIDDWLYEFSQLFQNHAGIDPDAHIDLNEIGMELCSQALENTLTSDDAQVIFEKAASKFQEVAALAFFNWGNVFMCAARKKIAIDDSSEVLVTAELMSAYDWVKGKYSLAGEKYKEALVIKPDFYEGVLALGQQEFEMAKLEWSYAVVNNVDLSTWDSSKVIQLFDSAMEKMKSGTEMWEKSEDKRIIELNDRAEGEVGGLLKKMVAQGGSDDSVRACLEHISSQKEAEQTAIMQSQIHLFWGNILLERSQVEFTLGHSDWKRNLDAAVERFKLTGITESEISMVMQNHVCNDKSAISGWNEKKNHMK